MDSKFCMDCGKPLSESKGPLETTIMNICPKCGTIAHEGDDFCSECGTKLNDWFFS